MPNNNLSFIERILLAFSTFFRILFDPAFAAAVRPLTHPASPPDSARDAAKAPPAAESGAPPLLKEAGPEAALQLLGLLQQEGRLVDFLEEDVSGYSDAEIGAATRVVHEGCRKALHEYITIEAIRSEQEGARVTMQEGFDAGSVRLTGNLVGNPPFSGTLTHRGWRATAVRLPKLSATHDVGVLAPAEVEL
jgi:hypothetical protein